jgi:hypothetical protein
MKRVMFGLAAFAIIAVCSATASAQTVVVPSYPSPTVPVAPVVGGTIVTTGVAVTGVIAPPAIVVRPPLPVIGLGYPYYYGYGRPYYYPHYYHRRW